MKDFILLMHDDAVRAEDGAAWDAYFGALHRSGCFDGGSSIGAGRRFRKDGAIGAGALPVTGSIRVRAADLAGAEAFLSGNPVYEAGGTIEIRELPRD
ncbi:hypothetical protein [Novosphingobium cyanobacteriorum]|uniref:YCII-related domain-containing protein n=1 Tax=Novosphingobium cyanobacteriorum TaxID=3024215 RepID=A0ABT6CIA5_9SPHN|nr:hypothetical protein [Novosphingobium cyanobacteriorum]MDF8333655.1 hypothetical protein [Novosphingobium cyanobacteriorum]